MYKNKKNDCKLVMEEIKIKRLIAATCLGIFTVVNTGATVMAITQQYDKKKLIDLQEKKTEYLENVANQQVEYSDGSEKNQLEPKKIIGAEKAVEGDSREVLDREYSLEQLNSMSNRELVDAITSVSAEKITNLFVDSAVSISFYNNASRMNYLMGELERRSARFTSNDDQGIPALVEVIRSGFYLAHYNKEKYYFLSNNQAKNSCNYAIVRAIQNYYFKIGNEIQNKVVSSIGLLLGTNLGNENIALYSSRVIDDFVNNINSYKENNVAIKSIENFAIGVSYKYRLEDHDCYSMEDDKKLSYGKINDLINATIKLSNLNPVNEKISQLTDTISLTLEGLVGFHSNKKEMQQKMTEKMNLSKKYSMPFFTAANILRNKHASIDSKGNKIDYKKLQEEGKSVWLPRTYVFDNGSLIIKAGDKITDEKIHKLYWASKEVKARFFRLYGNDIAIDEDKKEKPLTINLFNTPKEYKVNYYLNGVSTDNGGLYMDPISNFYTYERTSQDSVYSLEELFRHEFTHHLQCTYQVPGLWGRGDFYKEHELEWFDEATAEFFAGSTRTDDIKPRAAVIGKIADNPAQRFTLSKLFKSGYSSGWDFYNYGFAYASYMYNNDLSTIMELNEAIMNNNINLFREILQKKANDPVMEENYQKYMQELKNDKTIGTPLVDNIYTEHHESRDLEEIKKDISEASGIKELSREINKADEFSTFKIHGKFIGETSNGKIEDWKEMNAKTDEVLKKLSQKEWTGYKTVTAYFTDYKVVNGVYEFNIVFEGILEDKRVIKTRENRAPKAVIDCKKTVYTDEVIDFSALKSSDEDGQVISYNWDFGYNCDKSESATAKYSYDKPGKYIIRLTVKDDKGEENQIVTEIEVKEEPEIVLGGGMKEEVEPNDTRALADKNECLGTGVIAKGILTNWDDIDCYAFEVEKNGRVNMVVSGYEKGVCFYIEDKDGKRVKTNFVTEDGEKGLSFIADSGKYYLKVYTAEESVKNMEYTIKPKGIKTYPLGEKPEEEPEEKPQNIYESEPNNSISSANVFIKEGVSGIGTLQKGGDTDIFAFEVDKYG